jgi:VanZ family protein
MTFNRKFIKYWVSVILWMWFIFWMSTETFSSQKTASVIEPILHFLAPQISPQGIDLIHAFIRKIGHIAEYFILSILLFRAFRDGSPASWKWRWSMFAIIGVVLWAVSDEWHQSFVPTRTASVADVSIDTAGGILAQFASAFWHRCTRK